MTFHLRLMAALDAHQQAGAHMTPLHTAIRAALREANMKGQPFNSAEELARAVAPKTWGLGHLPRTLRNKAA